MGCGVSQSVIEGNDDLSKSDAFVRLCTAEKNPIAVQLNAYFNAITSECLYKSQGDMNGYERLLAKRPTEVTVNRSKLAAQRHGIGHKPLTVDGVNDIMNLFLGHVIKSLERRKWSGSFNYALLQPMPNLNVLARDEVDNGQSFAASGNVSPQSMSTKQGGPAASRKKHAAADVVAADQITSPAATAMASSRKSKRSTSTVQTNITANSNTLVFIDQGTGTRRDDDPSNQWRMELTGNITYPSIDGALTLICDCKVSFLFFTCDTNLPPPPATAKLPDTLTSPLPTTPLQGPSASERSRLPAAEAAPYMGPLMQATNAGSEIDCRQATSCGGSNWNGDERLAQQPAHSTPADGTLISATN